MHIEEILQGMRSGKEQPREAIVAFVEGVVDGSVSRPQAAAWLAWAFQRGLTSAETLALTETMTHTGDVLQWGEGPMCIDKHSTGGVGDKISLILAPLWAELGLRVPMISGRGLGHTGGTLDKLESIPGYRTDLQTDELQKVLADVGCFISGQTGEVAPADRVLYALRNEIQSVESIPLIVGSILSKKFAEGVQRLVLDVKTGSGAFMKTLEASRALAQALVDVSEGYGVKTKAIITEMGRPLGEMVGNGLEVIESVEVLKGGGPEDVRDLTVALADHPDAAKVLASGRAYDRFVRMVEAQGGDAASLEDPTKLRDAGATEVVVEASESGVVHEVNALGIGRAAFLLGAGRRAASDPVDFGVGLRLLVRPGEVIEKGQPLYHLWHRDGHGLEEALAGASSSIRLGEGAADVPPLIHEIVGA